MKRRYVDFINRARKHFYPVQEALSDAEKKQAQKREINEDNLISALIPKSGNSDHLDIYRELFLEDQTNPVVASFAVFTEIENMNYVPQKLKENLNFAKFLLSIDGFLIRLFPDNIKSDVVCCKISMNNTEGRTVQYISDELKKNPEWIISAVVSSGDNYQYIPDSFKKDRSIAIMAVQQDGRAFRHLLPQFQKDQAIAEVAVINTYLALQYLPDNFKDKEEIIKLTMPLPFTKNFQAFTLELASPRIQRNPVFLVNC